MKIVIYGSILAFVAYTLNERNNTAGFRIGNYSVSAHQSGNFLNSLSGSELLVMALLAILVLKAILQHEEKK